MDLKDKLAQIKTSIKPHIPIILAASTSIAAIAAVVVAVRYRNLYNESIEVDPHAWPIIEVIPALMKEMVEEGAILKVKIDGTATRLWTDDEVLEES